ncbi:ribosomal L28 family-domain-containing protein [Camillea tinctor]|nr:ribosomal L28 family-domain-containing protein [Camillea tinctor]
MPPSIRAVAAAPPLPSTQCLVAARLLLSSSSSQSPSTPSSSSYPSRPAFTSTTTSTHRAFSTTRPLPQQKPTHLTVPVDQVPDYPFGRFQTYKQRNAGLYGSSKIRFGNVVAPKWGRKSRTHWLPNRHMKRLWSPALGGFIRTRLTTSVLKTIDKLGGIDEYLLGSKTRRLRELGPAGWALRWKIMQTPAVQARFARERAALGLPPKGKEQAVAEAAVLPVSLRTPGATPESVMTEVDQMLAGDEEFIIGEVKDDEEILIQAEREEIGDVVEKETAPRPSP